MLKNSKKIAGDLKSKLLVFLLFVAFYMLCVTTAFASDYEGEITLKPSKSSVKVFEEVKVTLDSSNDNPDVHVSLKGTKKKGEPKEKYKITIDKEDKTFTVKEIQTPPTSPLLSLSASRHTATVKITSVDPAQLELASLTHDLNWTGYTTVSLYSRSKSCWSANPTPLNTHWYTSSCNYDSLSYIDGGRTIVSGASSSHYNYDFGTSARTNIYHDITIYGYNGADYSGNYNYYTSWDATGDSSALLSYYVEAW